MNNFTVEAIELTRLYGGREAVSNVNFTLSKGEVLGFLGPNGAGKSTTMKMLTGNLAPSHGSVKICGIDMIENPKEAKALIGYLPEMRPLYKELTVDEYLTMAARLHRVSAKHIKKAVENAKERCGLTHMSKRLIENLSNGYQQRVGIAQAIIHSPMVVILDEPTVGLDPIQIRDIRTLIREVGTDHSVIISTHILPEVEMVCDQVQIIDKGKLVFNGSIDVLKRQRVGNKLLVGLRNPPAIEEILRISGVSEAESLANGLIRVRYAENAEPAEAIVQTAVQQGWGLHQIAPDQTSLEDVFMQLTYQEQVAV
ncbi:ATP-binding cassette domain-containing protein [Methylotenera sp.]|uniref:ABC transporter ATP-binding protein n=1 Tax=Methylotenera sp. TaxID=2051956 RepID=UPI002736D6CD|nr:ATP-binding cassette domain-containing protein [Methylotenera sp.]MDP3212199.1 ATP-binding cassette domain-containing protein [Methylotenera sp.]MDP3777172.1 ATP-binding cassette domain-containing protein [Methylotenera sp.]